MISINLAWFGETRSFRKIIMIFPMELILWKHNILIYGFPIHCWACWLWTVINMYFKLYITLQVIYGSSSFLTFFYSFLHIKKEIILIQNVYFICGPTYCSIQTFIRISSWKIFKYVRHIYKHIMKCWSLWFMRCHCIWHTNFCKRFNKLIIKFFP